MRLAWQKFRFTQSKQKTTQERKETSTININDAFPSKYLKAGDLPEEGSRQFTIEKIEVEEIGREKQKKPVVYFDETDRGLVLNKTNAKTIAKVCGSEDFEDWTGKQINLYRAEVEFQGDMVEAIRVSLKNPKSKGAAAPEEDEIPF